MKKSLLSFIIAGLFLSFSTGSFAENQTNLENYLTPESKKVLDANIEEFLLSHPEILIKMSNALQEKETLKIKTNVMNARSLLLDPQNSAILKGQNAKVAVIEFFDYNCVYCSKVYPDVKKLIEANKDVDFVFKEFPIFASSQPPSLTAAATGLKILKEKGIQAYLTYHNGIYDTKHVEGALTDEDIRKAAASVSSNIVSEQEKATYVPLIQKNMDIKNIAGIQGTPYFIIMPLNGKNANDVQLIGGAASYEQMTEILNQVKSKSQ